MAYMSGALRCMVPRRLMALPRGPLKLDRMLATSSSSSVMVSICSPHLLS